MSGKDIAKKIREVKIGLQGKRALIVEGVDDSAALKIILSRYYPNWEEQWVIYEAGGKSQVQTALALEADWLGLVDRDEWSEELIQQYAVSQPNLMPLPRFCLENYLINPNELWPAIPEAQQEKVRGGQQSFTEEILQDLPQYVRHGALWKVVTPLWSGLRSLGFKDALAADDSVEAAQDDTVIKQHLHDWDELLNPETIFSNFEQELERANLLDTSDQLKNCVHGKVFWQNAVNPVMNRLFGQQAEKKWKNDLWKFLEMPDDLSFLADKMGL